METSIFSQVDIGADEISHLDEDNLIGHGGNGKLLDEDYVTKIADFGVAEISQTGFSFFAGTHGYISRVLGTKLYPDEAAVASYNVACCYSKLNQLSLYICRLNPSTTFFND
ncbi:unnamed protein product [Vicia faba]|uniref:Protein kinase domain-containing protein n=1 Tax=Vicia faba TaxID=3906 RepID=A0AAV0YX45_VICFA|nr:unnamed protein product [Vicia faba]